MKKNNKGFMLAETLVVSTFVSGVLIFLYIQFSNLSKSYEESYKYNTVEGLYALEDVREYLISDKTAYQYINDNINQLMYIDITDCNIFTNKNYCLELLQLENIDSIIVTLNEVPYNNIDGYSEGFYSFLKKINKEGDQTYRLVASFNNSTYATVRFGE